MGYIKSVPSAPRRGQSDLTYVRGKFSNLGVPLLVTALIIMAFGIGILYQKVQYLESGKANNLTSTPVAQAQPQPTAPPLTAQQLNQLTAEGYINGSPTAKVVFIEFADFQCPFCERFFSQAEPQLLKDYVDTGKVRFLYHDYAFLGQESIWAAEAAKCAADQGKFWDYHDYLFNHQGQENSGTFSKDNLKKFAVAVGLNSSQFNPCLDNDQYKNQVAQAVQDAQSVGVSGTPTTFVDGKMMVVFNNGQWQSVGAAPYSVFQDALNQALK